MNELPLSLAGQSLVATADHALVWPAERTAFVADVHFGKDATLRRSDRWIPFGTTSSDLGRLEKLILRHSLQRLVILGDAFHSEHAEEKETKAEIANWRARHQKIEMLVVRGNHDRHALVLAGEVGFRMEDEGFELTPWVLRHFPEDDQRGYVLSGHIHPQASLSERGRQWLRVPCFFIRPGHCVLPAFGEFTGGSPIRPREGDRVILIAEGHLIAT